MSQTRTLRVPSFIHPSAFILHPSMRPRTAIERSPPASGRWRRRAGAEASPPLLGRIPSGHPPATQTCTARRTSRARRSAPQAAPWAGQRATEIDREAVEFELCAILLGRGKIPRVRRRAVDAAAGQGVFHRRANPLDAAGAAEFGHESTAGTQRAFHPVQHGIRSFHPMQGRVAEDGVELAVEIERLAILDARVESALAGGLNLFGARIDANDLAASSTNFRVSGPSPQPRSKIRSPGRGSSSSTTPEPRSATNARCERSGLESRFAQA